MFPTHRSFSWPFLKDTPISGISTHDLSTVDFLFNTINYHLLLHVNRIHLFGCEYLNNYVYGLNVKHFCTCWCLRWECLLIELWFLFHGTAVYHIPFFFTHSRPWPVWVWTPSPYWTWRSSRRARSCRFFHLAGTRCHPHQLSLTHWSMATM